MESEEVTFPFPPQMLPDQLLSLSTLCFAPYNAGGLHLRTAPVMHTMALAAQTPSPAIYVVKLPPSICYFHSLHLWGLCGPLGFELWLEFFR